MDGMLSQEEINALLGGMGNDDKVKDSTVEDLTVEEKDAIGEISNICMGTAATTLYSLVNQKVVITTPTVTLSTWEEIQAAYAKPCVIINIAYKEGIKGNNILILKEDDVKVITDLMMGGDGTNLVDELSDLYLSAICEAMNQMMGSSATSLSSMLHKKIDISPPSASLVNVAGDMEDVLVEEFRTNAFVRVQFKMEIGDLVDSNIMQLYPIDFAKSLYGEFIKTQEVEQKPKEEEPVYNPPQSASLSNQAPTMQGQPMMWQPMM